MNFAWRCWQMTPVTPLITVQFGYGVAGHIAGPHEPFVSKFVWPRLLESYVPTHLPLILLTNLAASLAANLSIAVLGVANLLFFTLQL
jgi:hypothetical protein